MSNPRERALDGVIRVFAYSKKQPLARIIMDTNKIQIISNIMKEHTDNTLDEFWSKCYSETEEPMPEATIPLI